MTAQELSRRLHSSNSLTMTTATIYSCLSTEEESLMLEGFPGLVLHPDPLLQNHPNEEQFSLQSPTEWQQSLASKLMTILPYHLSSRVFVGERQAMAAIAAIWAVSSATTGGDDVAPPPLLLQEGDLTDSAAYAIYEVLLTSHPEDPLAPPSIIRLVSPFQGPYDFRYNWCKGHRKVWDDTLNSLIHSDQPVRVLEIGSWEGRSALYWLKNLCGKHVDSKLILADHFDNERDGRVRRRMLEFNIRVTCSQSKVMVLPYFSFEALTKHILPTTTTFDLVYVDGDHAAKHTLEDGLLSWNAIKKGEYLIFDDYPGHLILKEKILFVPPLVLTTPSTLRGELMPFYPLCMAEELHIISSGYQVIVQKKTEPCFNFPTTTTTTTTPTTSSSSSSIVAIVMAFDDTYVRPAAVAIK